MMTTRVPRGLAMVAGLTLGCAFLANLTEPEVRPEGTPLLPSETPGSNPRPAEVAIPSGHIGVAGWPCFQSDWASPFSICYPPDATLTSIPPDGARLDLPVAPGTNLIEKWLNLIALPGMTDCPPLDFSSGNPVTRVTVNGNRFLTDSGAEAGAGNIFEWTAYSTTSGETCVRLVFNMRSGNPLMYDPPLPEFDPIAERAVFEAILSTFAWGE